MRLSLLTFDAKDTIIQLTRGQGQLYAQVARNVTGINIAGDQEDKLNQAFTPAFVKISTEYPDTGLKHGISLVEFWSRVVSETFDQAHISLPPNDLAAIGKQAFNLFATKECWKVKDHADQVLSQIKNKFPSLKLGVISNGDDRLNGLLEDLGLSKSLDFVIDSYTAGFSKPSKQIFDLAIERTNTKDRKSALHVGDELQTDYIGAKSAGWNSILLGQCEQVPQEHQISSLSQLLNMIEPNE